MQDFHTPVCFLSLFFALLSGTQDDTPVIFSVDYPWALPLHVEQDIPKAVCCFKVHDIDLRTSPTNLGVSES